ncbi:MAG: S-layer homology domain-containing protein [Clostridia bacterium]|nr:S-layer homology domain-containing protein [Clostridia bacterium]
MKKFIFAFLFICVFVGNTAFAYGNVTEDYNLIIQEKYGNNQSRLNVAKAICEIIEERGYSLYKNCETYFTDCDDPDVQALRSLGIIVGNGDKTFSPYNQITQTELETVLKRTDEYLDNDKKLLYSDNNFEKGFVCETDEYFYYTAPVEGFPMFHYGFYSYDKNTGEKIRLGSMSVNSICEYNGRVYYEGGNVTYIEDNAVYDMGIKCYDMCIYDGYIYGCYDPETGCLSRYNIYTRDMENLGNFVFYGKPVMDKNELYHLQTDEDKLLKMTIGEWVPEVVLEGVKSFSIAKDYIYYSTEDSLFKLDKSSGETEKLLSGYEIVGITVYDGEVYCKFYGGTENVGGYYNETFLGIIRDGKLEKVVDEHVLNFIVNNGRIYISSNNALGYLKLDEELQTKENLLSEISLGMSYEEVVKSIGMPHIDNGSGIFVYGYRTADYGLINLWFDKDYKLCKIK